MRASPACRVTLSRFGVWRSGIAAIAICGVACLSAWSLTRADRPSWALIAALLSAALLIGWIAVSLARVRAVDLRWDGQRWHLGEPGRAPEEALSGELTVAIDLGPWMLLLFTEASPATLPRRRWLPAQRAGLESQWHGLRCAVYSPRPSAAVSGATGDV